MNLRDSCRSWWNKRFRPYERDHYLILRSIRRSRNGMSIKAIMKLHHLNLSLQSEHAADLIRLGLIEYRDDLYVVPRSKRGEVDLILRKNRRRYL